MIAPCQVPHVMHVIDSLACGGAERMLVDLANATRADGHAVSVCVTRQGLQMGSSLDPRIPVAVLDRQRRFDLGAMWRFAHLTRRSGAVVLHAHGRSTYSFVALAKTLGLVRGGILMHDHFGIQIDRSVPAWFTRWGRHYLSTYVGVCHAQAEWARSAARIPRDKVHCIMNRLDLSRFAASGAPRDRPGEDAARRLVGVLVGGIRFEKGLDVLIQAAARSRCRDRYRILVVGDNRDALYGVRCRAEVAAAALSDTITFVGECERIPSLLADADFGVVSSRSESGPLVLIEYLASGLPVVTTRVGQVAEAVVDAGLAEAVPPGQPEALAEAIDRLVETGPDTRRELGRRGRLFAIDHFEIRHVMNQWYDLYRRTAGTAT